MNKIFSKAAKVLSDAVGTWQAFVIALSSVVIWLIAGIWIGYSNEVYQLSINSGTTIITFLMLFLLQHSQNHDSRAIHIKLDEIILSLRDAKNTIIAVEERTEDELSEAKLEISKAAQQATTREN